MSWMNLDTDQGRAAYSPGETVTGSASWQLDAVPKRVELRLIWYTEGQAEQEVRLVGALPFEGALQGENRPFRIDLPAGPYSFRGSLFSIRWGLELVAEHPDESTRLDLVVAPSGQTVTAEAIPETPQVIDLGGFLKKLGQGRKANPY